MAYEPHFLLQFGGTLGTPVSEIWSCGIRMHSSDFTGFDEVGYLDGVAAPALAAWFARPASVIAGHAKLTFAKFNPIGADGNYSEQNTNEFYWPGVGISGGGGAGATPFQCSLVMSFRTKDVTRGPASKGRIYQPAPAVAIAVTGYFPQATALAAAQSMATLINTLDVGIGDDTLRPHIMSNIGAAYHQIDWVDCDNRVDVQRRRANALDPVYSEAEVLY